MTWFVERAIDRATIPASIWDANDLRFIAENKANRQLLAAITGQPKVDRDDLAERTGFHDHLRAVKESPGERWHVQRPWGWWALTLFRAERWHARPDLIVVTAHLSQTDDEADRDQRRLLIMLATQEATEKTLQAIETAGTLLGTAAAGLEAMAHYVTEQVDVAPPEDPATLIENLPPEVLTGIRRASEG